MEMQQQEMKTSSRTVLRDIPTVIETEDQRGNTAFTSTEIKTERQKIETTKTPSTIIQKEPSLEGRSSESDEEVPSDSVGKAKHYSKEFVRSFFYELYWSVWFLSIFYVFQPNCKCKIVLYKIITDNNQ